MKDGAAPVSLKRHGRWAGGSHRSHRNYTRRMNGTRRIAGLLLLAAGAAPAGAADDVDLQVRGNDKVSGTLRPADERERFLIAAPRGARITASVKKTGSGGPVPALDLLDGLLNVVEPATPNGKGAKLRTDPLATSDQFRLRVAGDGLLDGDYQLKLKVAAQTNWTQRLGAEVGPGAETTFAFAAPANASADIELRPARGSSFVPLIVDVAGPSAFLATPGAAAATPKRHFAKGVALGPSGEYAVRIRNTGAAAGTWTIAVRLRPARVSRSSVDIRDGALTGSFGGDAQVFGRVVDPAGGLIDPPDDGGGLDGASIFVPPDAVGAPSVIALQASDTFFVDDGNHAAGIAVSLTPSGTVFATPVTVTLPYDPQSFDDPVNELTIFIQDGASGQLQIVPRSALVFDTLASTVSFPTSHFSRFQGTSPRPRAFRGPFVELEIQGSAQKSFGSVATVGLHRVNGLKGPRTGNGFNRHAVRRVVGFDRSNLFTSASVVDDNGTVTIVDDGTVTLAGQNLGTATYVRGRSDDVYVASSAAGTGVSVLLRIAKGLPTLANLAGRWHGFVFEMGAHDALGGGPAVAMAEQRTELDFAIDGTVRAGPTSTQVASRSERGGWQTKHFAASPKPGKLTAGRNGITLDMNLGVSPLSTSVELIPVLKGDVLVGATGGETVIGQTATAGMGRVVILVRAAERASAKQLIAGGLFREFGVQGIEAAGPSQDLSFLGSAATVSRADANDARYVGALGTAGHDAGGSPAFATQPFDVHTGYFVAPDGTYRETAGPRIGAFSPRSGFYVTTQFGQTLVFALGFGVTARPTPP